jgi:hypothetical protein
MKWETLKYDALSGIPSPIRTRIRGDTLDLDMALISRAVEGEVSAVARVRAAGQAVRDGARREVEKQLDQHPAVLSFRGCTAELADLRKNDRRKEIKQKIARLDSDNATLREAGEGQLGTRLMANIVEASALRSELTTIDLLEEQLVRAVEERKPAAKAALRTIATGATTAAIRAARDEYAAALERLSEVAGEQLFALASSSHLKRSAATLDLVVRLGAEFGDTGNPAPADAGEDETPQIMLGPVIEDAAA